MSQAGTYGDGGSPVLPDVETLTGDSGGAVGPTLGNIDILGIDSTEDNGNGITIAGTPGSSLLDVTLTNRIPGTATTTDAATTTELLSFAMGSTTGTYLFDIQVIAINTTSDLGSAFQNYSTIRMDGATPNILGTNPSVEVEESGGGSDMDDTIVNFTTSGSNLIVEVNGLAGETINWRALATYIFVS